MSGICLLSTAYLPPVQYISKFLLYKKILIEQHENFSKQSYRNRCNIYGANGQQTLSIPVRKNNSVKIKITDVQIDYDTNWQKIHFKSIESAYRHSPFYEYYIDYFMPFFKQKHKYLFDFNTLILNKLLEILEIKTDISFTTGYITNHNSGVCDCRDSIHPKKRMQKPDNTFKNIKYQQVFSGKFGFLPNLSTLDLLFNEGPNAVNILSLSVL